VNPSQTREKLLWSGHRAEFQRPFERNAARGSGKTGLFAFLH
jgi:hypothetical protein